MPRAVTVLILCLLVGASACKQDVPKIQTPPANFKEIPNPAALAARMGGPKEVQAALGRFARYRIAVLTHGEGDPRQYGWQAEMHRAAQCMQAMIGVREADPLLVQMDGYILAAWPEGKRPEGATWVSDGLASLRDCEPARIR